MRAAVRYRELRSAAHDGVPCEPGRAVLPNAGNGSDGDSAGDPGTDSGSDPGAGDAVQTVSGRADLPQPVH